jgi:acetylornithine/succinyldiaminopimelate/putrescine aminotransferase
MPKQIELMNNRNLFFKHLAQTSDIPLALEIDHANRSFIYDTSGKKYLDFISGIGVSNIGHCHPKVIEAIQLQSSKYLHTLVYGEFVLEPQTQLAGKLCGLLPETLDNVYFLNSGAEAVEAAIKLSKRISGRTEIVSFDNAYHGSTSGALSISGNETIKNSFRPLIPTVRILEFNNIKALEAISTQTAAVFIEPVQGEAGVKVAETEFLKALQEKCRLTSTLLVFDEIQCGLGRTGKLFAFEHYGIVPDILLAGKALGGGLPLSAMICNKTLMDHFQTDPILGHITTFGGNPLCCAAALANLEVILEEKLMNDVPAKEALIRSLLKHPKIHEIRGKGLLLALQLDSFEQLRILLLKCLDRGLILDWFLFDPTSVRLAPPLNISNEEIKFACGVILEEI